MDVLAERLDAKLREWKPELAEQVRQRIAEIMDLADQDVLDVMRSTTGAHNTRSEALIRAERDGRD